MRLRTTLLVLLVACVCASPAAAGAAEPFAAGCPTEAPEEGTVGHFNHNPAAKKAIVPRGATSVRVCRYWGFANAAGKQTPKSQARIGRLRDEGTAGERDVVESVTLEFEDLAFVKKGTYNCPLDEGEKLYAVFSYPVADPVVVEVKLSGCEFVNNGGAPTRSLAGSLSRRLEHLAEGISGSGKARHTVKERRGVAFPPPHLSYDSARVTAEGDMDEFCKDSMLCASHSVGHCERKSDAAFNCPYTATLKSGEVCRGGISVAALGPGLLSSGPGTQDIDEGECFYLFAPPGSREELEEIQREREEEREAKPGRRPES